MSKKDLKSDKNNTSKNSSVNENHDIKSVFDDLDDLDDEKRVKSLSPTMLVLKRFSRNKIAIVGIAIIIFMFVFSFVGGLFYPHGEIEVFFKDDLVDKEYAGITYNTDFRFVGKEGVSFSAIAKSKMILAISTSQTTFNDGSNDYTLEKLGDKLYNVYGVEKYADVSIMRGIVTYKSKSDKTTDDMLSAFEQAVADGEKQFEYDGVVYYISTSGRNGSFGPMVNLGYATVNGYRYNDGFEGSYDFTYAAELAAATDKTEFNADGKTYSLNNEDGVYMISDGSNSVGMLSNFMVQATVAGTEITIDQVLTMKKAVDEGMDSIKYGEGDDSIEYKIQRKDSTYIVRVEKLSRLIDIYASPSLKHPLGTDANGMDVLARLMYGGRISLLIGFIVIFLETLIGVILGGIAGFFGRWVDNLIMRIVDIFNCIPTLPIYLILGSIMDTLKIDPKVRIFYLMFVLGVLGWPGVARIVRGQILSLREQEFMIAAEATGISSRRRIFKHLVPNVIPQLIVICTMGLGDVILSEATLSFLNLGVKFPYASWGNIINSVSDVHSMTNFWFIWIPAGLLILLTVLGFNFIGDGLRDAFDPKMKR